MTYRTEINNHTNMEKRKKKKTERENKNPLQNANMCNCDGSLGSTKSIFHKKRRRRK